MKHAREARLVVIALWLALGSVACPGKSPQPPEGEDVPDVGMDAEPEPPAPTCDGRPLGTFWLERDGCTSCVCTDSGAMCSSDACMPELTCEEIEVAYDDAIAGSAGCETDSDCRVLSGQCGVGLGVCHEAVGGDLFQEDLSELGVAWLQAGCEGEACACDPAPPAVCEGGRCALGKHCGEYDLGENWAADDGCNTCTCTLDGEVCTEDICGDPCEGVELPECPEACGEEAVDGEACEGEAACGDPSGHRCDCIESVWACRQVTPPVEGCALVCHPPEGDACEDIPEAYEATIDAARDCEADEECQVLFGQCGLGLGDCYEATNDTLSQQDLSLLGAAFFQAGCTEDICTCDPAPPTVCEGGRCALGKFCGDYDVGQSWEADDGCNTCTCTFDGAVCTDERCPECEEIEGEYAELIDGATACEVELDCQILEAHCGVGDCFEYVNFSIEQEDIDEINTRYQNANCRELMLCHCMLPFEIDCVGGRCKGVFE